MEQEIYMYVTCRVCCKKIVTGMTNFSNSGKVEVCGDSKAVHSPLIKPSNVQGICFFCIAIKIIKFLNFKNF